MEAITIPKGFRVTPEQFDQLAQAEQLARMELTKDGELIVMSSTGGTAGGDDLTVSMKETRRVSEEAPSRTEGGAEQRAGRVKSPLAIAASTELIRSLTRSGTMLERRSQQDVVS